jgi:N-acetylglucosamine kinase-like BadF-type ATPase
MEVILTIDGGGSRTRCLAIDRDGQMVGRGESGPSNHLLVSRDVVIASLDTAIDESLAQSRLHRDDVACVSAGLAGVDYDGSGAVEMEEVFRALGFARAVVNGDMVIAHAGALGGREGVVALAGTGSVVLGIGRNGERVKVGGWGPVYGDEGSAYRIAQLALTAAAKAFDGRGPRTVLVNALTEALGVSDFSQTVSRIYVEKMEPREIASLSRVVSEKAEFGDEVARSILFQAGEELAGGVIAAIRRLDLTDGSPLVSYQGAILESSEPVRERFTEVLRQEISGVIVRPPEYTPVIGAYLLGREVLGMP